MTLKAAVRARKRRSTRWSVLGLRTLRRLFGRYARELVVLCSVFSRADQRFSALFMPSHGPQDGASNLRGYLIAQRLRILGWNASVCHPSLTLRQRRRIIRFLRPDVILMQMARHPLNRPSLYEVPTVFDIDDADYVDPCQTANVVNAIEQSAAVIAGSQTVAEYCRQQNRNVHVVWTGTPVSNDVMRPQVDRDRVVTWAALRPVLCPAEARFVHAVLRSLIKLTSDFRFLLYCDDGSRAYETFADQFRKLGIDVETRPLFTKYSDFLESLDDAAVGLAPLVDMSGFSAGKSFGKLLAYMDRGIPIVTHPVVDHPLFFENGSNGYMAESADDWALIIAGLLADPAQRQQIADAARIDLRRRLSTEEAARQVEAVLMGVIRKFRTT